MSINAAKACVVRNNMAAKVQKGMMVELYSRSERENGLDWPTVERNVD
jgi:hypothetical protein